MTLKYIKFYCRFSKHFTSPHIGIKSISPVEVTLRQATFYLFQVWAQNAVNFILNRDNSIRDTLALKFFFRFLLTLVWS